MGDDVPLPVLAGTPHMLYDYFKQRFAQVGVVAASHVPHVRLLACLHWLPFACSSVHCRMSIKSMPFAHVAPLPTTPIAQVTNPPIDPLREGLVMSLEMRLGGRGNLLQPGAGEPAASAGLQACILLRLFMRKLV